MSCFAAVSLMGLVHSGVDCGGPCPTCVQSNPLPVQTAPARVNDGSCEDAFIYCPGRSTCFSDPNFNGGATIASGGGWSIAYDPSEGTISDCLIYSGVDSTCNLANAKLIGTSTITNNFIHYCFDVEGYVSDTFDLYVGCCDGNTGGDPNGQCDQAAVQQNALNFDTFPVTTVLPLSTISFHVDRIEPINTANSNYESGYTMLPLDALQCGGPARIVGHTCATNEAPATTAAITSTTTATDQRTGTATGIISTTWLN